MENRLRVKAYYSDTDAYGVVWHGSYLRWMEMGRVNFSQQYGLDLLKLQKNDIVLPVVEVGIRYKLSAMLDEDLEVITTVDNVSVTSITFKQIIKSIARDKTCIEGTVKVVAVNSKGELYRRLPKVLADAFKQEAAANV